MIMKSSNQSALKILRGRNRTGGSTVVVVNPGRVAYPVENVVVVNVLDAGETPVLRQSPKRNLLRARYLKRLVQKATVNANKLQRVSPPGVPNLAAVKRRPLPTDFDVAGYSKTVAKLEAEGRRPQAASLEDYLKLISKRS